MRDGIHLRDKEGYRMKQLLHLKEYYNLPTLTAVLDHMIIVAFKQIPDTPPKEIKKINKAKELQQQQAIFKFDARTLHTVGNLRNMLRNLILEETVPIKSIYTQKQQCCKMIMSLVDTNQKIEVKKLKAITLEQIDHTRKLYQKLLNAGATKEELKQQSHKNIELKAKLLEEKPPWIE